MIDLPRIVGGPAVSTTGYRWFRGLAILFAIVLAGFASWIMAAELLRPISVAFPTDPEAASNFSQNRIAARRAARAGVVRGDLWGEYALTYSDVFRREDRSAATTQNSAMVQQSHDIAERALALAPYDARIWLLLAGLRSRFDWLNGKASSAVRMSYYTGANEIALIPVRLALALSLPSITDKDFQQLVTRDLRIAVTRHAELKPAILTAYKYALPEGQEFVRSALKDLDPNLLTQRPQK